MRAVEAVRRAARAARTSSSKVSRSGSGPGNTANRLSPGEALRIHDRRIEGAGLRQRRGTHDRTRPLGIRQVIDVERAVPETGAARTPGAACARETRLALRHHAQRDDAAFGFASASASTSCGPRTGCSSNTRTCRRSRRASVSIVAWPMAASWRVVRRVTRRPMRRRRHAPPHLKWRCRVRGACRIAEVLASSMTGRLSETRRASSRTTLISGSGRLRRATRHLAYRRHRCARVAAQGATTPSHATIRSPRCRR